MQDHKGQKAWTEHILQEGIQVVIEGEVETFRYCPNRSGSCSCSNRHAEQIVQACAVLAHAVGDVAHRSSARHVHTSQLSSEEMNHVLPTYLQPTCTLVKEYQENHLDLFCFSPVAFAITTGMKFIHFSHVSVGQTAGRRAKNRSF